MKYKDKQSEWVRNRQRNKDNKGLIYICQCPVGELSVNCPVKEHRERAKLVQGFGSLIKGRYKL